MAHAFHRNERFVPFTAEGANGRHTAGVHDCLAGVEYHIDPLGEPYSFGKWQTAIGLAEHRAARLNAVHLDLTQMVEDHMLHLRAQPIPFTAA